MEPDLRPELPQAWDAVLRGVAQEDRPGHSPDGATDDPVGVGPRQEHLGHTEVKGAKGVAAAQHQHGLESFQQSSPGHCLSPSGPGPNGNAAGRFRRR